MNDYDSPAADLLDSASRGTPASRQALLEALGAALEARRRLRAAVCADLADRGLQQRGPVRQGEHAVTDCPPAISRRQASTDEDTEAGSGRRGCPSGFERGADDAYRQLAQAILDHLAAADHDSGVLVERLTGTDGSGETEALRSARRCHGLIADVLVEGAIDLAVQIGIPDSQLPL